MATSPSKEVKAPYGTPRSRLVLLLAESSFYETRPQNFLPPVHALRIAEIMPAHIDGGDGLPVAEADGFHRRTQLFVFVLAPSTFRTESCRFRRASRLGRLGRLVVDRLGSRGLLLFCRGLAVDVGHLGVGRRRRLEQGHGARRQHTAGREDLRARRRVEAEEHRGARARGLPPAHVGQNCPRGLPRGAAGLRGWGRPSLGLNVILPGASRRRAAPGWAVPRRLCHQMPTGRDGRGRRLWHRARGVFGRRARAESSRATLGGRAPGFFLFWLVGLIVGLLRISAGRGAAERLRSMSPAS